MELIAPPRPDAEETRDNRTFEALMWAMARPGTTQELPEPGLGPIALALVDIETRVYCEDPALRGIVARTGARTAEPNKADFLFVADEAAAALKAAPAGSALYPDDAATLVIAAPLSGGPRLRLTGPGIEGSIEASPLLSAEFWSVRARRSAYPLGHDLIIVEDRRVIALPRSTHVEVL